MYKIVLQLVPNPGLEMHNNPRTKVKTAEQNSSAPTAWIRLLRNGGFLVIGPRLYNSILATLKELENDDEWEKQKE